MDARLKWLLAVAIVVLVWPETLQPIVTIVIVLLLFSIPKL